MKSELIVDVQPQEIAIALTEDDRLQEVNREKRNQDNFAVGNIYYGRVKKVMPALNAVFVDVGYEKEAFPLLGFGGTISNAALVCYESSLRQTKSADN